MSSSSRTDSGIGGSIEGPAVAPLSFGPFGGQILVADDVNGQVHAIKNDGTVTLNAFNWDLLIGWVRKASR